MLFTQVNPETFIDRDEKTPEHGRGAWNKVGKANGSWRYEFIPSKAKIGTNAQESLDAWATCAGSYAYQKILVTDGYLRALAPAEMGVFGQITKEAVIAMQKKRKDPETGKWLDPDGTIGTSDARALMTPLIEAAESRHDIPLNYLRGETNLESKLDCGALGYYIYYGASEEYRGVDRGSSQINSLYNPQITWDQAFDPYYALEWSAARMRDFYDRYKKSYPHTRDSALWDAALCAHNNPSAAQKWAKTGQPPTEAAAAYVANAKAARY